MLEIFLKYFLKKRNHITYFPFSFSLSLSLSLSKYIYIYIYILCLYCFVYINLSYLFHNTSIRLCKCFYLCINDGAKSFWIRDVILLGINLIKMRRQREKFRSLFDSVVLWNYSKFHNCPAFLLRMQTNILESLKSKLWFVSKLLNH